MQKHSVDWLPNYSHSKIYKQYKTPHYHHHQVPSSSSRVWRTAGSRKKVLDLLHQQSLSDAEECMDGCTCHVCWIVRILKPYVELAPEHLIPIIFVDSYRCHIMDSVVNAIQSLGCKVQHILGGCTGLCQPVDVCYEKPFKSQVCASWVQWMISDRILHGTTSPLLHAEGELIYHPPPPG